MAVMQRRGQAGTGPVTLVVSPLISLMEDQVAIGCGWTNEAPQFAGETGTSVIRLSEIDKEEMVMFLGKIFGEHRCLCFVLVVAGAFLSPIFYPGGPARDVAKA